MFYVIRNNSPFGPYSVDVLAQYVEQGRILLCDKASAVSAPDDVKTVGFFLKQAGKKVRIKSKGSLSRQFKDIGHEIVFPRSVLNRKNWFSDQKFLVLALVGLLPAVLNLFIISEFLTFYTISLYFSAIWGLFFFYLFKTGQVTARTTLLIFFATQLFVFVVWDILGLNSLNPFYLLEGSESFLGRFCFFTGGVGLTEELAKALPLILLIAFAKEPLIPQTMVFYGLISGIAFGVFEGVQYQMTVNAQLEYGASFMMNISRLTSLPFIHALWAGIAGYYLSFALLYPRYRKALYILAICVPALIHGTYDTACSMGILGWIIRIPVMFMTVVLLMTYLKTGTSFQSKLSN